MHIGMCTHACIHTSFLSPVAYSIVFLRKFADANVVRHSSPMPFIAPNASYLGNLAT